MKSYIKRSWLVILGYVALIAGVLANFNAPLHGDVLIPLLLLYAAYLIRERGAVHVQDASASD